MTYELAPATLLVASRCYICNRPLRDALSVEAGIGPICREKHGYDAPDVPARLIAAGAAITVAVGGPLPENLRGALAAGDARKVCNALVHHIAALPLAAENKYLMAAISACGYTKLAARLAERLDETNVVRVTVEGDHFVVESPFSEAFNAAIRAIWGSRWDRERKVRTVPLARKAELWTAVQKGFPEGTLVIGAHVTVLGQKAA
jgi:hypothetical protein